MKHKKQLLSILSVLVLFSAILLVNKPFSSFKNKAGIASENSNAVSTYDDYSFSSSGTSKNEHGSTDINDEITESSDIEQPDVSDPSDLTSHTGNQIKPSSVTQSATTTKPSAKAPVNTAVSTTASAPAKQTLAEKNDVKRQALNRKYNLDIRYSNEINNVYGVYKPFGEPLELLTDEREIDSNLTKLESCLAAYPDGMFKEIYDSGMALSIYLVKGSHNKFAGLVDKQFYANPILVMTDTFIFSRTFHHEMMHFLDLYIECEAYPQEPYEGLWGDNYNPLGFSYGSTASSQYVFYPNGDENAYFFTNYSKTNEREDRAELFSEMMNGVYQKDCLKSGKPLRKKADAISAELSKYLKCVTSSTHPQWTKNLK